MGRVEEVRLRESGASECEGQGGGDIRRLDGGVQVPHGQLLSQLELILQWRCGAALVGLGGCSRRLPHLQDCGALRCL